ncbi:hypothetical protein GM415_11215 [Pseudodesulfovibrio cashew]|uniref:Uncharacterized protein n=1 Tax=Pseudodesulfovibrio cashew TaxID=2678688 RepID=A0A6I6JI88_9BACT|nr:hypothetical protein [Pseudodesulfovibrio cashew]QGY40668.1 hypothetical protein GM415_11215 [Pseudodesulfovibrio cashew]
MDENVIADLKLAFACDLYETVKAARKNRDESVFRHTMADEDGQMVFASVFPKKDVLEIPDLTGEFASRLKTFNLLGVITDGKSGLDVFYLGGLNKPFTSLTDARDIDGILEEEALAAFLQLYFKVKGVMIDISRMNHEEFLQAVESEVFKNTSFAEMQEIGALLDEFEQ